MVSSERTPLWDSVTHSFANALELAFGCHHAKLSRVFYHRRPQLQDLLRLQRQV